MAQHVAMISRTARAGAIVSIISAAMIAGIAHAETLQVADDAPAIAHIGAATLLYLHIGGGLIGMLSGLTAVLAQKGATIHRAAGKVFFVSMAIAYLIGGAVAPFLESGQRPNFVAGILALYLLFSGVLAARSNGAVRGAGVGLVIATIITAMGALFAWMGSTNGTGTIDGSPPHAFYLFMITGAFAIFGEARLLIVKQLSEAARIARHLWRMCTSFFIASGSFFLGQPQVFPDSFNATPAPFLLAFLPLLFLAIWMVRASLGYFREPASAA